jgi:hypothetical protein
MASEGDWAASARASRAGERDIEAEPEAREAVDRLLEEVHRVRLTRSASDSPARESRARLDPLSPGAPRKRSELRRRRARFLNAVVGEPRLDELLEERRRKQVLPPDLVQPAIDQRLGHPVLASREAHRDDRSGCVGIVVENDQELLGFVETTL